MWKDETQCHMECDNWVLNIADGHISSLANLYLALKKPIYAYALSIVRDCYIAEDITQETFLKITTHAGMYHRGTNAKAWIFTIVRNLSITELKSQSRINELNDAIPDTNAPMENIVENTLDYLNMINILEAEEREILTLHLAAGLKFSLVSKVTKISPANVRSKYYRALGKLKKNLKEER